MCFANLFVCMSIACVQVLTEAREDVRCHGIRFTGSGE